MYTQDVPQFTLNQIPCINKAQMVEVDSLMMDEYGIDLVQMMENAGRNLARLAMQRYLGNPILQ